MKFMEKAKQLLVLAALLFSMELSASTHIKFVNETDIVLSCLLASTLSSSAVGI